MPLASMTGYGAAQGRLAQGEREIDWRWEVKSVNGKGLDVRLRLPPGFDRLDAKLKRHAATRLGRGNVQAGLTLEITRTAPGLAIDEAMLADVIAAVKRVQAMTDCAPPSPEALLSFRGVVAGAEGAADLGDFDALDAALTKGFDHALDALIADRQGEGARLEGVLGAQLDEIADLSGRARTLAAGATEAHFTALKDQIAALLPEGGLAEDRVAAEAAALAVKSDVAEELDRLAAHLAAAREAIAAGGVKGRRLDFLSQEFAREANTLTVKAPSAELKDVGLSLKLVVDQWREQIQNIE